MPSARAIFALATVVLTAPAARADLLLLRSQEWRAGVVREEDDSLLVSSSDRERPPERLPRDQVLRWLRGTDERDALAAIESAAVLTQLAEQYFAAGMQLQARQCLERAARLDRSVARSPRDKGPDEWRDFWNRTLLAVRQAEADQARPAAHIELARWAYAAGLRAAAIEHLRAARRLDPRGGQVEALQQAWGLDLRPLVEIDLTPALNERMISRQLTDESVSVQARDGHQFVAIPFRFRLDTNTEFKRGSFDLKASPPTPIRLVGFRPMVWQSGVAAPSRRSDEPVYERMQVVARDESGRPAVFGFNTTRPPRGSGAKEPERLRTARNRLATTGWAMMLLEVPETTDLLTITPVSGPTADIRLAALQQAGGIRDSDRDADSADVARWLRFAADPSPAVALLAIQALTSIRRQLAAEEYGPWSSVVDPAILSAWAGLEEGCRQAAWRAMMDHGPLPARTSQAIVEASPSVKLDLVERIAADFRSPPASAVAPANTVAALAALLKSEDPRLCRRAIDVLAAGAPDEAYETLVGASGMARAEALARCRSIRETRVRQNMVRALAVNAAPVDSEILGSLIKQDRVVILDPRDKLLERLRTEQSARVRETWLAMLQGISMLPVLGTSPVGRLLDDVSDEAAGDALRRRATLIAADQARIRSSAAKRGSFPMLSPADATDPVVRVLRRAIELGPADVRSTAVLGLLQEGHAQIAAQAILEAFPQRTLLIEFIDEFALQLGSEAPDATFAFLAHLLGLATPDAARRILDHLDRLAELRGEMDGARVNLCIRAGLVWQSLADFSGAPDPMLARSAARWAMRLGHLSPQDRIQYAASNDRDLRADRLRTASNRSGRIASGSYSAIVVIELAWPMPPGAARELPVWLPPQRVTLSAGAVELAAPEVSREFRIYVNGKLRGFGTVPSGPAGLPLPEDWVPRLARAEPNSAFSIQPADSEAGFSPLVMVSGEQDPSPRPGAARMEVSELLRSALVNDPESIYFKDRIERVVPMGLSVTLRYAGFGSWVGVGVRRNPAAPTAEDPGPVFLNAAIMLERVSPPATTTQSASAATALGQSTISTVESPMTSRR